jgi:acyl carrier protein
MTAAEIRKTVIRELAKIAPEADFEEISSEESLRDALDIDSFDFLNFIIGLHKELGVEIPESDYGKLTTLDAVVGYLEARAG